MLQCPNCAAVYPSPELVSNGLCYLCNASVFPVDTIPAAVIASLERYETAARRNKQSESED